jgi:hypothetical protein
VSGNADRAVSEANNNNNNNNNNTVMDFPSLH